MHQQDNHGHPIQMKTATLESIKKLEYSLIGHALNHGNSIALWRLPKQTKINLLLTSQVKLMDDLAMEDCKPGFVFAPFDPSKPKHVFEADHLFEITSEEIIETTHGNFLEQTLKEANHKVKFHKHVDRSQSSTNGLLLDLVKQSIQAIEVGAFEKVVPSARKIISINEHFDLLKAFEDMAARYPSAMVSLVSDEKTGTWLGASPELLVSTDRDGIFRTVALAGTQVYHGNIPLRNISWTQKEIEEQALVERYIISCFKKIRVREFDEHGPKTVQAGNLVHLKSDFEVDIKAVNFPLLGSVMLKLLHPTSAVCGMPMEASFNFLKQHETHDREFYAGYLGPVNIQNESHIFVNLRCMKYNGDSLYLYAGAGVTIDSEAEMEVKEVEMKMEGIVSVLGNRK
jgi:isochorismate synthase